LTGVEPNPAYHAGLRLNRSCAVVPKCISDKVETVDFTFPNNFWEAPLGGVNGGQFKNRRPEDARFVDVTIECDTVASMLTGAGVTHIDYFSIDVEGHERRLLTGIDFSKVTFDVILCESHCGEILKANGYAKIKLKEMGGADKIFLRKDGPYGHMLPEVPLE
jgi:FkbM family methyltransferase